MNSRFKFVVVTTSTCLVILLFAGAMRGRSASPEDAYRHLAVYTEVLSRIKSDYVEEPDMKSVTLGAINGMLESIDPYASYLNAEQYKEYLKEKDENRAGVGLVISKKFGYVGVIDSIPGSAAAKAGLTTGDILETINSVATRDMPLAYAELLLSGEAGTSVELSVLRVRKPEPQKLTLIREPIHYPAVTTKLNDQVGIVQVPSLEPAEEKTVAAKVQDLEKQGAKRLVLDLRHCSTGSPEEGVQLANLFLDKGLIAYTQGQKSPRKDIDANSSSAITHLPLVVIVGRGTADGAEIAAAALLDDKRAEVVGERTYGDAAIRKAVTMDDGSAVILSVAKYYSPSGKAIQDTGVTPSVPVQEADANAPDIDEEGPVAVAPEQPQTAPGEDLLMKKAIEVVTQGKSAAASAAPSGAAAPAGPIHMGPLNIPAPVPDQR
ncbi:MAG: S41 family peptidase [Bryobacteraceae bacterium]